MRPSSRTLAVALGALTVAGAFGLAACGGNDDSGGGGSSTSNGSNGTAQRGGTYRVAQADFGFNGAFDPVGEYLGFAWTLQTNLMIRPLVGYRHTAGTAGNEPLADLAEALPEPTDNGLTYTFKIKKGVKFGPPVNREVTSKDVAYAFQRLATKSLVPQYFFYYTDIVGFQEAYDGKAKTISGITTPDKYTIVFKLKRPVGDFLYRLAMPATAPVPQEVAKCFTQAGEYGRYVISSGPYMFAGSDKLKIGNCNQLKPISGFNPSSRMLLVRNPNYDPKTDSTEQREALPDRFDFVINTNAKDIFDKIEAGEYDDSTDAAPAEFARRYSRDDTLKNLLYSQSEDSTAYIFMNLATPPFDDVNVRRAVNFVIDKSGLQRAWGGPLYGDIATHIIPNTVLDNSAEMQDYDPYATPDEAGDVAKAKAEMAKSKYDTDKDGTCDAGPCRGVLYINRNVSPYPKLTPIIRDGLAKIGITVEVRELPTGPAYTTVGNIKNAVQLGSNARWGKDYADPLTFSVLFDSRNLLATGNSGYSLVGMTRQQAQQFGIDYPAGGIPSVNGDIDRCKPLSGDERLSCWVALDKKLMEQVVPWVPYLFFKSVGTRSSAVTKWDFDQFGTETAYAHVAVDPSKQK